MARIDISLRKLAETFDTVAPETVVIVTSDGSDTHAGGGDELLQAAKEWEKSCTTLSAAIDHVLAEIGGNQVEVIIVRDGLPYCVTFVD